MTQSLVIPSEETPLLCETPQKHEAVYLRFSSRRKMVIVAIVSWIGLLPRMRPSTSRWPLTPNLGHLFKCSSLARSFH